MLYCLILFSIKKIKQFFLFENLSIILGTYLTVNMNVFNFKRTYYCAYNNRFRGITVIYKHCILKFKI